jgi:hypothetical protein
MPPPPQVKGEDDWMAKYFFSGGTMPSHDLLLFFQQHLTLASMWWVNGAHYSRTLEAWLRNQDRARRAVLELFERTYGRGQGLKWFVYWRLFYLACSELFNFSGGEEWGVGLYLFTKPGGAGATAGSRGASAGAAAAAAAAAPKAARDAGNGGGGGGGGGGAGAGAGGGGSGGAARLRSPRQQAAPAAAGAAAGAQ